MAELPLEASQPSGPFFPGSNFLKGALGMPIVRQVTLLVALAASLAFAVFATMWMQTPDYRPITGQLSPGETSEVIQALESAQIPYSLNQQSGMVMVPADQIYSARMRLADSELLDTEQLGYKLFGVEHLPCLRPCGCKPRIIVP